MTPSPKSQVIEEFLESRFRRTFMIKSDRCVACNGHASYFRDKLSVREYTISGLCQRCQDEIFNPPADDE